MSQQPTAPYERLDLVGLRIRRMIAHQVYKPDEHGKEVSPHLSSKLTNADPAVTRLLGRTIGDSLGKRSWSIPIAFEKTGSGSYFDYAKAALSPRNDDEFIANSREIAMLLAEQQKLNRSYPAGVVIVIQGRDARNRGVLLTFKCELGEGLASREQGDDTVLELAKDLLLTPGSTTYKVCAMVKKGTGSDPQDFNSYLFDAGLKRESRLQPTAYFAKGFLGAVVASTGRADTVQFFAAALKAINSLEVPAQQKASMRANLVAFVSVTDEAMAANQGPVVTANQFIDRYVPPDMQDDFENTLRSEDVTDGPIALDPIDLRNRLKKTSISVGEVVITGPTFAFDKDVTITEGDGVTTIVVATDEIALK